MITIESLVNYQKDKDTSVELKAKLICRQIMELLKCMDSNHH